MRLVRPRAEALHYFGRDFLGFFFFRFHVLRTKNINLVVLIMWLFCSLADIYYSFGEIWCFYHQSIW
jgi:hypothetical protein